MKLIGNIIQKSFLIKHKGKKYCVNYLNSDYPNPNLLNRDNWEIVDEDGEELNTYFFKSNMKNDKSKITLIKQKYDKLISFCIENFDNYNPKIR